MTLLAVALAPPRLLVLRVAVAADAEADTVARRSWSMPTTAYGAPVWQLPVVLAYAARLRHTQEAPGLDGFAAYLHERSGGTVAVPTRAYRGDPLHDPRVMFWIDVRFQPRRTGDLWPGISMVLTEHDVRACGGTATLITRCHGPRELAGLARDRAAEHQGLPEVKSFKLTRQLHRLREWTTTAVTRLDQDHTDPTRAAAPGVPALSSPLPLRKDSAR